MSEPKSIKQLCRELHLGLGGQTRRDMGKWLDDSLMALYEAAVNQHGPEHAAALMYWLCSRDPSFKPPHWLLCRFRKHRAHIVNEFGGHRDSLG